MLKAGVIYTLGNVASAAVPFVLLPLLTRVLHPSEYGQVIAFALMVTLAGTVAGLNVHSAVGVTWFKRPLNEMSAFTATALVLCAASSLMLAPLMALGLWLFPSLSSGLNPTWGAVAALTAGANVILQCRLTLWQSQRKAIQSASLQIVASVCNAGLSLVAVLALHWGGSGRNAGIATSSILMALIAVGLLAYSREIRWSPTREQLRTLVVFGLPLVMHILAGVLLSTADRWTVSIKLDLRSLGIYGAGAQLGSIMSVLADAFVKAYNPWLYAKLASPKPHDKLNIVGAIYVGIPLFLMGSLAVGFALFLASAFLLGPQYRSAAVLLPWFVLGGGFTGIYVSSSVLFFFSGRTTLLASTTMTSALLGALMTWVLVSAFGVQGAAAGYGLTQGILALAVVGVAMLQFDLPWQRVREAVLVWRQGIAETTVQ